MTFLHKTLLTLLLLTSMTSSATSRMAYAEVLSINGIPCFTISRKEEVRKGAPRIGALVLSDVSVKPAIKVWSFIMQGDTTISLSANTCIA